MPNYFAKGKHSDNGNIIFMFCNIGFCVLVLFILFFKRRHRTTAVNDLGKREFPFLTVLLPPDAEGS